MFWGLDISIDVGIRYHGLNSTGIKKFIDLQWPRLEEHLSSFSGSNLCSQFNQLFPILLWIESYFLPVIRGARPGAVHFVGFDPAAWEEWRRTTDVRSWLDEHSLSIEDLSAWRHQVLLRAFSNDPAPNLYLLLRSMPFGQRERFKGRLRLAYDLYELAELARKFLEQVSDQKITKEWDPTGHPDTFWVQRMFGAQPTFGSPEFLRPLVRHYGLDPAFRVRWLVEGPTEEDFMRQYSARLGANLDEFVTFRNFSGDGSFKKQLAVVDNDLEAAKQEQCFATLTVDESDGTRKRLDDLEQRGLINLRYVVNQPDFELENFRVDQLVAVARTWAAEVSHPIGLSEEILVEEVSQRISEKSEAFEKALNSVLHLHGEPFKLHKGTDWGRRLADLLSDERESEVEAGAYSEQSLNKVEQQVQLVLKASQPLINFPLSMEHLEPGTLEITRPSAGAAEDHR